MGSQDTRFSSPQEPSPGKAENEREIQQKLTEVTVKALNRYESLPIPPSGPAWSQISFAEPYGQPDEP